MERWAPDSTALPQTGSESGASTAQQESETALLTAPPAPSIVVDKAEVEKDDHLKSVIKKYFNNQKFRINEFGIQDIEMVDVKYVSVKSISGTTFIADIKYRYALPDYSSISKIEYATSKIEKTAESYKVISFDRKR